MDPIADQVSWAIHCWSCPLCWMNGTDAMAYSGQDHVTELDRHFAHFLIGALGLHRVDSES
jgi:hypothetical protein